MKVEKQKNIENIKFGQQVSLLRHRMGISQEKLSFLCNLNRTYIGEIERGEKNVSIIVASKIAKGLNTNLKTLFDYE